MGGVAALIHQLLWTRRLIDLLGASHESSTRVLGGFFLGLALGAAVAAWRADRIRSAWRAAGFAEFGVVVLSLPMIFLPHWSDWLWPPMGSEALMGFPGSAAKTLIALIAVFPPACCMGFSFPLIVQATLATRRAEKLGSTGLILYGLNTLGGALGLFIVMSWLLEALGSLPSMLAAAGINLLLGGLCLMIARRVAEVAPTVRARSKFTDLPRRPLLLAFVSGSATLALEILGIQMILLVAPSTLHAPGVILFAVILTLAIPPLILPWLLGTQRSRLLPLLRGLIPLAALATIIAPIIFMLLARNGFLAGTHETLAGFHLRLIALTLLALGPAWFLLGTLFPLGIAWADSTSTGAPAFRLGGLLAVNGLGGFLGAELALHLLLPAAGIYGGIATVAVLIGLTGLLVPGRTLPRFALPAAALVVLATIGWKWVLPMPILNPHLPFALLDEKAGPEGSVAVVEDPDGHRSIIVSNQYTLGGTGVRYDQERQMLLPLLLHSAPRQVVCIGVATGITPGAALSLPEVEHLTAIELSPLVARAAETWFTPYNHGVTRSPRASIAIEDGRTYIAASPNRFDVVCGDLFLPWSPGETRLYSREHFTAVRDSLRDGGVFCQWLAMYQLTPDQFESIGATFAEIFPDSMLFINHFRSDTPMLGMVGWKNPRDSANWHAVASRRSAQLAASGALLDPVLRHPDALELLYLSRLRPAPQAPIVMLDDPWLEFSAARERLTGNPGRKYFYGKRWVRFCQHLREDTTRPGPARTATALQALEFFQTSNPPKAAETNRFLRRMLPPGLLADDEADWARWPGTSSTWKW